MEGQGREAYGKRRPPPSASGGRDKKRDKDSDENPGAREEWRLLRNYKKPLQKMYKNIQDDLYEEELMNHDLEKEDVLNEISKNLDIMDNVCASSSYNKIFLSNCHEIVTDLLRKFAKKYQEVNLTDDEDDEREKSNESPDIIILPTPTFQPFEEKPGLLGRGRGRGIVKHDRDREVRNPRFDHHPEVGFQQPIYQFQWNSTGPRAPQPMHSNQQGSIPQQYNHNPQQHNHNTQQRNHNTQQHNHNTQQHNHNPQQHYNTTQELISRNPRVPFQSFDSASHRGSHPNYNADYRTSFHQNSHQDVPLSHSSSSSQSSSRSAHNSAHQYYDYLRPEPGSSSVKWGTNQPQHNGVPQQPPLSSLDPRLERRRGMEERHPPIVPSSSPGPIYQASPSQQPIMNPPPLDNRSHLSNNNSSQISRNPIPNTSTKSQLTYRKKTPAAQSSTPLPQPPILDSSSPTLAQHSPNVPLLQNPTKNVEEESQMFRMIQESAKKNFGKTKKSQRPINTTSRRPTHPTPLRSPPNHHLKTNSNTNGPQRSNSGQSTSNASQSRAGNDLSEVRERVKERLNAGAKPQQKLTIVQKLRLSVMAEQHHIASTGHPKKQPKQIKPASSKHHKSSAIDRIKSQDSSASPSSSSNESDSEEPPPQLPARIPKKSKLVRKPSIDKKSKESKRLPDKVLNPAQSKTITRVKRISGDKPKKKPVEITTDSEEESSSSEGIEIIEKPSPPPPTKKRKTSTNSNDLSKSNKRKKIRVILSSEEDEEERVEPKKVGKKPLEERRKVNNDNNTPAKNIPIQSKNNVQKEVQKVPVQKGKNPKKNKPKSKQNIEVSKNAPKTRAQTGQNKPKGKSVPAKRVTTPKKAPPKNTREESPSKWDSNGQVNQNDIVTNQVLGKVKIERDLVLPAQESGDQGVGIFNGLYDGCLIKQEPEENCPMILQIASGHNVVPIAIQEPQIQDPPAIESGSSKCEYCTFISTEDLVSHYITAHRGLSIPTACLPKDVFENLVKNRSRPNETHIRINLKNKTWPCLWCSETFEKRGDFSDHLSTHTGEFKYGCPLCPLIYSHQTEVKGHLREVHSKYRAPKLRMIYTDTNEKSKDELQAYLCGQCYYFQLYSESLSRHIMEKDHSATVYSILFTCK